MKSIIQENSTIVKAISQAWDEAGKPQEFSVKILQEPETNFFGMTTRSAKVAIFFNDTMHKERGHVKKQRSAHQAEERPAYAPKAKHEQADRHDSAKHDSTRHEGARHDNARHERTPRHESNNDRQQQRPTHQRNAQPSFQTNNQVARQPRALPEDGQEQTFWTQEMIDVVDTWMKSALGTMEMSGVRFDTHADRYLLTVKFGKALHADDNKEKDIYRSLSLLAIQSLKHKLKRPLRGFKILLTRA